MDYRRFNVLKELERMAQGESPSVAAWLVARLALDKLVDAKQAHWLDSDVVLTTQQPLDTVDVPVLQA